MDWLLLSSICSIEFDLFGNRTHWKSGVRFRSIAELNPRIEFDLFYLLGPATSKFIR